MIIDTTGGSIRTVSDPLNETSLRGARDGFVENLEVNISLLRRSIKDPNLAIEKFVVGRRSRTDLALVYIKDLVNTQALDELRERINAIDVDSITGIGAFQEFIDENPYSLFPMYVSTERPDRVTPNIMEGRVAVLLNGSPFVLTLPSVFVEFFHTVEDYNERTISSNIIRLLRFLSVLLVITLPSIYLTLIKYNGELIPVEFVVPVVQSRIGISLSPFMEILILEILMEILREGGLRLLQMKRYSLIILSISCILIYIIFNSSEGNLAIEKIDVCSGLSFDLIPNSPVNEYMVAASAYTFTKKGEISSVILQGIGKNIADTRSTRQATSSKQFLLGLQKVFIFSEGVATYGINPIVDIMFSNQQMNDATWNVVCKGNAIDMLKLNVEDAATSADHIDGMIESSTEQNFMHDDYKVIDMFVRVDSEGRNLTLPYLEILNNKITLTGMAVFKRDKMVTKVPMDEARYMNILREDGVKGILTLQKDSLHFISTYGESKRKVKYEKINGENKFNIDIEFKGQVVNNTMYPDFMITPKTVVTYSHELEEQTEKRCNEFISKMQKKYKVDCLELGRDAAATFGRNPETDWDNVVCNSDITVNVTVKIDNLGRGQFLFKEK